MTRTLDLDISHLGAQGDGVAETDDGPLFVPFTLPGERVTVAVGAKERGELHTLITPSPDRVAPPCPHFGVCGGCAVQHMATGIYRTWKRDLVVQALAHRGFHDLAVAAPLVSPPGSRRRAALKAVRKGNRVILGFSARQSNQIIDLEDCPVLRPEIFAVLQPLRGLLGRMIRARTGSDVQITLSDSGLDLVVTGLRAPTLADRQYLSDFAAAADIARLVIDGETLVERRTPQVHFAGVTVALPPGAFLQATAEGEAALVGAVGEMLKGATKVADLFAGLGTFALPLAKTGASVYAVEGDPALVGALKTAAQQAALPKVTTAARDLFRNPLRPEELKAYDAVAIDPPRAGARAQAEALAASVVPRVAMVSCNPATFARDARILVDGGYALVDVRPVDQFLWSPHVELVGAFVRG